MKIRHLKRELKAKGYQQLRKRGKGSHTVWRSNSLTIVLCGKKNSDVKPYQLKLIK